MRELFFEGPRPVTDRRTGVLLVPGLNEVAEDDADVLLCTRRDVLDEARLDAGQEDLSHGD